MPDPANHTPNPELEPAAAEKPPGKPPVPRRPRRARTILLCALLVMAAALVGLWLRYRSGAPLIRMLRKEASSQIDGSLEIKEARLELTRGLRLRGVTLRPSPDAPPVLTVAELDCEIRTWRLLAGRLSPARLRVVRPVVRLEIGPDGQLNLARLIKPSTGESGRSFEEFFTEGVALSDATVELTAPDLYGDKSPRRIDGLDVRLTPASPSLDHWSFDATVRSGAHEGLRAAGRIDASRESTDYGVRIELPGVALSNAMLDPIPLVGAALRERADLGGWVSATVLLRPKAGDQDDVDYQAIVECRNVAVALKTPPLKGVEVSALCAELSVDGRGVRCDRIAADVFSGEIEEGRFRLAATDTEGLRYSGDVTLKGLRLEELLSKVAPNSPPLKGRLSGKVSFGGAVRRRETPIVVGNLTVDGGNLAKLPILTGLYTALHVRIPTAEDVVHSGSLRFSVRGQLVAIDALELHSNDLEITGGGLIDLARNKALNLTFVTATKPRTDQIPILRFATVTVLGGIERQLTKLHVTGTLDAPNFEPAAFEDVLKPASDLFDLLKEKTIGK